MDERDPHVPPADARSEFYTVRGYERREQSALTSAMEDYVEMIYRLSAQEEPVRVNTLSELLHLSAPSVTRMVKRLGELGLVDAKKYGDIALSETGKRAGDALLKRHNTVETFLRNLGVHEDLLTQTELIEHNLSPATVRVWERFNAFAEQNPALTAQIRAFCSDEETSGK